MPDPALLCTAPWVPGCLYLERAAEEAQGLWWGSSAESPSPLSVKLPRRGCHAPLVSLAILFLSLMAVLPPALGHTLS